MKSSQPLLGKEEKRAFWKGGGLSSSGRLLVKKNELKNEGKKNHGRPQENNTWGGGGDPKVGGERSPASPPGKEATSSLGGRKKGESRFLTKTVQKMVIPWENESFQGGKRKRRYHFLFSAKRRKIKAGGKGRMVTT